MKIKYQGVILLGDIQPRSRDGRGCYIVAEPEGAEYESDMLFSEYTFISGPVLRTKYRNSPPEIVSNELMEYTLSKAKARIAFGMFEKGKEYKQEITSETLKAELEIVEDFTVQKWILTGLSNLRKKFPLNYKVENINIEGICALLNISKEQYLYNASILLEDLFIREDEGSEIGIEGGNFYITSNGIRYLQTLNNKNATNIDNNDGEKETGQLKYKYDVAITFAGEDRKIAQELAQELRAIKISVFFDEYEKSDIWGKNLYDHFSYIYGEAARYCIMLLSINYAQKVWTNLERQSAQARAFREKTEYILPIRIDDTQIPGLLETVGYIKLKDDPPSKIAELVYNKLKSIP